MTITFFLLALVIMVISIDVLVLILFQTRNLSASQVSEWPMVSILVPMRDEASNVKALLECLFELDYPQDKIEILIGEDRSIDDTPDLLKKYARLDPRVTIIDITTDLPRLVAKANVIGQLIPYCKSDYYFITDADVRVPPGWLKALLTEGVDQAGVIGGTTVVESHDFWSNLQRLDWLLAQGLLFVAGNVIRVVAVSGTNMMITKACCQDIGGYQKIPYSLTEDIGMLTAAKRAGYTGRNVLDPMATAVIQAQPGWKSLISQRSRWVYGVLRLPTGIVFLLLLKVLFLPAVLWLASWWGIAALVAYLLKSLFNLVLIQTVGTKVGQTVSTKYIVFFELYWFLMAVTGLVTHVLSSGTSWKGRKY